MTQIQIPDDNYPWASDLISPSSGFFPYKPEMITNASVKRLAGNRTHSNWVIEGSLMKRLFAQVWAGLRKTDRTGYNARV